MQWKSCLIYFERCKSFTNNDYSSYVAKNSLLPIQVTIVFKRQPGWRFFEEIIRFITQWCRIPTVHQIRSKCYSIQLSNLCLPEMRPPHPGLFAGPCCLAGVESWSMTLEAEGLGNCLLLDSSSCWARHVWKIWPLQQMRLNKKTDHFILRVINKSMCR